ncbi:hypothetical protein CH306_17775 [Rhodococcus sp. 15-725-2-2b]|nr:hypothetical protein CH276_15280 [Rhodococcus sp. 06-470-2]OZC64527.1 hypothetical protein CH277_17680 [Rhodococcus sp. 06-469-3-2]OZD51161.1 hypothetical protein CH264_02315 [Rhodococcus sp. 06-1477-1A]OZE58103.1 hypothetical protein CH265_22870 [Rhodococcus sp. 05-2221-1B]OZE71600.1 hypothetical protein CH306_17775 [Rhodococcus sp. 15-725-2-2b]
MRFAYSNFGRPSAGIGAMCGAPGRLGILLGRDIPRTQRSHFEWKSAGLQACLSTGATTGSTIAE